MENFFKVIYSIPTITSYIAFGVVYLTFYRFIRYRNKVQVSKYDFVITITANFILRLFFDSLSNLISKVTKVVLPQDTNLYYIAMLVFTILLAYAMGLLCSSDFLNKILLKLKVERTTNVSIWDDAIRDYTWLYVRKKDDNFIYWGECKYIEENEQNPRIVLCRYQVIDAETNDVIGDYSNDMDKCIMIDTTNIKSMEILYNKDNIIKKT